jgi:hypothetical protein
MRQGARFATVGWLLVQAIVPLARGQEGPVAVRKWPDDGWVSSESFLVLPEEALIGLYRGAGVGDVPCGWVDGRAIPRPGSRLSPWLSRGAQLVWQGKTFRGDATAINRFFGTNVIEGEVFLGTSWLDGQEALVLDYGRTSWIYGRYRDEIRMISPGLYLGLMYDRTKCPPRLVRLFALEARRGG